MNELALWPSADGRIKPSANMFTIADVEAELLTPALMTRWSRVKKREPCGQGLDTPHHPNPYPRTSVIPNGSYLAEPQSAESTMLRSAINNEKLDTLFRTYPVGLRESLGNFDSETSRVA